MNFKYRWKNGAPPTRDQTVRNANLLDEDQFTHPNDQQIAEEAARKYLGVPSQIPDDHKPVLPQSAPPPQ